MNANRMNETWDDITFLETLFRFEIVKTLVVILAFIILVTLAFLN